MIPKMFTAEYNQGKSVTFYINIGDRFACIDGRTQRPFSLVGTFYEDYDRVEFDYQEWYKEGVTIDLEKDNPFTDKEMGIVYKVALGLVFQ